MADLELERFGRVVELRLARNALNTLSPGLVAELRASLAEIAADDGVGALVLASAAPKFFSAGWDLPELLELDEGAFLEFYRGFVAMSLALASLPAPSVAAIGGHVVAGGAILALACDWRVMATGKAMLGLNEVDLGVPMPLAAALLAREVGGWRGARDLIVAGAFFSPADAEAAGLVDATCEPEALREAAHARADALAKKPVGATGRMKGVLRAELLAACEAGRERDEADFVKAFFDPGTRELLKAAAEKLVPRSP